MFLIDLCFVIKFLVSFLVFGSHFAVDDGSCCRMGEFTQCHGLVKDLCE